MARVAERATGKVVQLEILAPQGSPSPPHHCKERMLPKNVSLKRMELLYAMA